LIWPVLFPKLDNPGPLAAITIGSIYFWAVALCWIAFVKDANAPASDR
jgi:hypothetical protein